MIQPVVLEGKPSKLARQLIKVPYSPLPSIKNAKPKNNGHVLFNISLIIMGRPAGGGVRLNHILFFDNRIEDSSENL